MLSYLQLHIAVHFSCFIVHFACNSQDAVLSKSGTSFSIIFFELVTKLVCVFQIHEFDEDVSYTTSKICGCIRIYAFHNRSVGLRPSLSSPPKFTPPPENPTPPVLRDLSSLTTSARPYTTPHPSKCHLRFLVMTLRSAFPPYQEQLRPCGSHPDARWVRPVCGRPPTLMPPCASRRVVLRRRCPPPAALPSGGGGRGFHPEARPRLGPREHLSLPDSTDKILFHPVAIYIYRLYLERS